MRSKLAFLSILILSVVLVGCKKDNNNNGTATLNVRLTDAPANYDQVNVDIQGVEIHSDVNGWEPLIVNAGVYNLLDYINGADTLIASNTLPAGTVSQIRLILGNNNTVVEDGQSYPLETPSAQQSGLKLQVHKELLPDVTYIIVLDFDAHQSIVKTGNGKYILKPVIKVLAEGIDGVIRGTVDPAASNPLIYAISGNDTASTNVTSTGDFMIQGLTAGTYTVEFHPVSPYNTKVVNNVSVTVGNITDLGVVQITQ